MTINTEQLEMLAKKDPKHAELFGSLYGMDRQVKKIVRENVELYHPDPAVCSLMTEISDNRYVLSLYDSDTHMKTRYAWELASFLSMCSAHVVDKEIKEKVRMSVKKLRDPDTY